MEWTAKQQAMMTITYSLFYLFIVIMLIALTPLTIDLTYFTTLWIGGMYASLMATGLVSSKTQMGREILTMSMAMFIISIAVILKLSIVPMQMSSIGTNVTLFVALAFLFAVIVGIISVTEWKSRAMKRVRKAVRATVGEGSSWSFLSFVLTFALFTGIITAGIIKSIQPPVVKASSGNRIVYPEGNMVEMETGLEPVYNSFIIGEPTWEDVENITTIYNMGDSIHNDREKAEYVVSLLLGAKTDSDKVRVMIGEDNDYWMEIKISGCWIPVESDDILYYLYNQHKVGVWGYSSQYVWEVR